MITLKKSLPVLLMGFIALCLANCKPKPQTESDFITKEIFTTNSDYRVNGLQDLLYISAQQALSACQVECTKQEAAVSAAGKEVAAMESLLLQKVGGISPPPPPRPCQSGSCIWDRLAIFRYFVDLKKYGKLPNISIQNLNGEILSSSEAAEVLYSPDGGQFAVVNLPQVELQDKVVKMVIAAENGVAEVVVSIQ